MSPLLVRRRLIAHVMAHAPPQPLKKRVHPHAVPGDGSDPKVMGQQVRSVELEQGGKQLSG